MSVQEVMEEVRKDIAFFDESLGGVTLSGGEPLMQSDFALELVEDLWVGTGNPHRAGHLRIRASWSVVRKFTPHVNLFLYDLKALDVERHLQATGQTNESILENLRQISGIGAEVLVRIPVIPGVNNDKDEMNGIGTFLAGLPKRHPVELLAYHDISAAKYGGLDREV